ncbi:MAG: FkbM family methyltransferase [Paracoccaceae bacterium]
MQIPLNCLSPQLVQALESGRYEHTEAAALQRHLAPSDRVLDLGAGAGYLAAISARIVGADRVTAVEAAPAMIAPLRRNLDRNEGAQVRVVHGAVVADDYSSKTVPFLARKAFWAGAIAVPDQADNSRVIDVPALRLRDLLRDYPSDVVVMDIEGGEQMLARQAWPPQVRLLIVEIHTKQYSPQVLKDILDGLSGAAFTYMPWGSRGETLVFQRVK